MKILKRNPRRLFATGIKLLFVCVRSLVASNRFGKLIGTRRAALAFYAFQKTFDFVKSLAFDKTGNALQVAAATADKTNVVKSFFRINVKKNLSGTSADRGVSKHNNTSLNIL